MYCTFIQHIWQAHASVRPLGRPVFGRLKPVVPVAKRAACPWAGAVLARGMLTALHKLLHLVGQGYWRCMVGGSGRMARAVSLRASLEDLIAQLEAVETTSRDFH